MRATICLYSLGCIALIVAVMPPDSTWNTPAVLPEPRSSYILGSEKSILSTSMSTQVAPGLTQARTASGMRSTSVASG